MLDEAFDKPDLEALVKDFKNLEKRERAIRFAMFEKNGGDSTSKTMIEQAPAGNFGIRRL